MFDDANIDSAVEGAMASKYRNAGQTCVCANRIYVQDAVYEPAALAKVQRHLDDAIAKGGKVMVGGKALTAMGAQFFEPTVIAEATSGMACAREETFGPFAPVFRFTTDQEAVDAANDTEFGLASYFYSRDIDRIYRTAEELDKITVNAITTITFPTHFICRFQRLLCLRRAARAA